MSDHTIERDIDIEAPIDVVWRTITEPDQVRRWLCDAVEVDARPGASGILVFTGDDEADPLRVNITVVAAERPHRYSFRWCHPDDVTPTPGNSVLVTFTLVAEGEERTRLRVEETGLEGLDWPDDEKDRYVESHSAGWQERTDQLRRLFVATP